MGGIFRSNQSTFRYHHPSVKVGMWVQAGDLLADSRDSLCGQFVVGRNLLLGYIPWDGLNFEDAVIANKNLVTKEVFTSAHIEEWTTSSIQTQSDVEIFVPFSKQLVICIGRGQRKFWVAFSFISERTLSVVVKRIEQIFFKENVLSWVKKKKGFSLMRNVFFQIKRNFFHSVSRKIIVKSLDLLEKIRTWKLRKKYNLVNNLFNSKILTTVLWHIKKQNRCEFFFYTKNLEMFFEKVLISKYIKYRTLVFGYFQTFDTSIGLKERWNFFFPGYKTLDYRGFVKIGSWVNPGQILALRICPLPTPRLTPYEWLLFDVLDQKPPTIQNVSFRTPDKTSGRVLNVEVFPFDESIGSRFLSIEKKWKDLLNPFFFKNKKITFTFWSLKSKVKDDMRFIFVDYKIIPYRISFFSSVVLFNGFLIFFLKYYRIDNSLVRRRRFDCLMKKKNLIRLRFSYFFEKINLEKKVYSNKFNLNLFFFFFNSHLIKDRKRINFIIWSSQLFTRVRIIISVYRRICIGDKIAGRHGNKGILARLVPSSDIPYLPNGISLDFVLNPLGIPSRMNVGQMYEAVLSLSGFFLGEEFVIPSFDERSQESIISRSFVFEKLREARVKTRQTWLFNLRQPGKLPVFDGRTSEIINQDVAVGESYILKLVHIVDNKIHARAIGSYSLITQQPLRGRSRNGGQRVGEMERWALEGFGTSYILQEILTVKSDDLIGRGSRLLKALFQNRPLLVELPDTFRVLACELQALCLDIILFCEDEL